MAQFFFDEMFTALLASPRYYDQYGTKEPTDRLNTLFAFSHGRPGVSVWDDLSSDSPSRMENFMGAMKVMDTHPFIEPYSLDWAVSAAAADESRAVVVDVGGGYGHALKGMAKSTPGLALDRCVLEDLPEVVDATKAVGDPDLAGVKFVGMDFHKEQPVKKALVYYFRRILHDYSDDECIEILRLTADVMGTDSRVLMVELVLTDPPSIFPAMSNVVMTNISGKERTLDGFRGIIVRAGLTLVKAHEVAGTDVGIIECAKA